MMGVGMKITDRIGRRMKLHDLHVLMSVVQAGSMGRAASLLNTTQPAISRSITELEHAVGVRLLDRSRQGVEPTDYGLALLDGGAAVFDDLRQAVKNIELLADPTIGHVTICGSVSISAALLPAVFGRLRQGHPGLSMHVVPAISVARQFKELRERKADLALGRLPSPVDTDIDAESEKQMDATAQNRTWSPASLTVGMFQSNGAGRKDLIDMLAEVGQHTAETTTPTTFRQWCEAVLQPAV
jgi:Bacterial regulatory helix-turn-helix protein, lysR family/LysR substrate binding domain